MGVSTNVKRFTFAVALAIGFLIGGVAGWLITRHQYERWAQRFATSGALPELGNAFSTLKALRSGDTNEAIDLLEGQLDGAIIQLGAIVPEETDEKMKAAYIRALTRVRDYRSMYPYRSGSAEVDNGVADVLSAIGTNQTAR